ncbi:MAG: hypothetical protein CTR55_18935 [Pseudomonas sp.]|uniref:DUF4347 domain-containing protein n=1 Tax=Pseudomonas sp. TaxID=306 RepID=UPI000CC1DEAD|nr:DUF4347 domain-containing protein [Pseudomonas sp.]PJI47493.1 MAG: hypothetical protein CTR55_18935 [Pseudomonas sp.]
MAFWKRNTTGGKSSSHAHRASLIQALEPRMMFDASVAVVADQAAQAVEAAGQHDGVAKDTSSAAAAPAATAATDTRREVVFVDGNVQDYKQLTSQLPKGSEVVVLDPSKNGLQQMADYLKGRTDLDAIHLISHGGEASVQVGSTRLTLDNVDAMKAQLEQIGASLGADGDLLIYGCDVAKGADGSALLSKLAGYTDADVAASSDWSGDAGKGGDWVLETATGAIESQSVLAGVSYDHVLNTLNAGDMVVLGWNALTDTVTLATLVDIPAGTVIKFTDKGWDQASDAFTSTSTGDGTITWTTTGTIAAGTRLALFFGGSDQPNTLTNVTTGADLSGQITGTAYTVTDPMNLAGDSLFIYQDTDTNPYFIFGFNNSGGVVDANGWNTSVVATLRDSMLPDGTNSQNALASGVNAVGIPGGGAAELDNIQYTGPITGADRATWLARVTNSANWAGDNTGTLATAVGSTVSLNVVPDLVSIAFTDNNLKIGETSTVTFIFNTAVTGFTIGDLTVPNGFISGLGSSDGGLSWTGTFTPNASTTDASNVISVNLGGVTAIQGGLAGSGSRDSGNFVIDTLAPSVSSVSSSTANGVYRAGDTISIQVTFNENVLVTGTPQLSLETGTTDRVVNYSSGSGSNVLTFTYTVQAGDTSADLDYLGSAALAMNGGSIRDSAGNDATLTLAAPGAAGSLGANKAIVIDSAPSLGNLNGDSSAWGGIGNNVTLDTGSDASLSDVELSARNGGNGDWNGASLTLQRPGTAVAADIFGFNTVGALFTVSGNNLQVSGQTFATFSNSGGVLTISFTSSGTAATTALVNDVARHITYRNDTPAGDATVRFSLSDGTSTVTANTTVNSDFIYVTNAVDTATIDASNGVSFSEAVAIAAADSTGSQTIVFTSALAGQTITLAGNLSIGESLTLLTDAANGLTITGSTINLGGGTTLTVTNFSGSTTLASALAGTGALSKSGGGTLALGSTANEAGMLGAISVKGGTLQIGSDDNLSSGVLTLDGGTLSNNGASFTVDNAVVLGSAGGSLAISGGTATLSGVVSGGGALSKTGSGTVILSGSNTYTGATMVAAGVLTVSGGNAIADVSNVTVSAGATLSLSAAETLASLAGAGAVQLGSSTLTVGGGNQSTTFSGSISGGGSLTKIGSGTLILSGSNSYAGTTAVQGGTLMLNGSISGNTSISVQSGATLGGTGTATISGAVAVGNGGTLSPGYGGAGTLTINGNLIMSSGAVLQAEIHGSAPGTGYDQVLVNGQVIIGTNAVLAVSQDYVPAVGTTYALIVNDAAEAINGSFTGLAEGSTFLAAGNGTELTVSYVGGTGNDFVLAGPLSAAPILTSSAGSAAFVAGDNIASTPVAIDSGLLLADPDSATLASATVRITGNLQSGQDILQFVNDGATMGDIVGSYDPAQGILTLTSVSGASLAQWQAALRSVQYTNSAVTPNTASRTISFQVNDGSASSAIVSRQVTVTDTDQTPIVSTSGGSATFTEGNGGAGAAVVVDGGILISDLDNVTLANAVVHIAGNFHSAEDLLSFTNGGVNMGNITGTYNTATGVLTLTSAGGTATLAQWQAALRSVTYSNSSDNPDTAARTISFVVNDGAASSIAATRRVDVVAVNDAPVLGTSGGASSYTEGGSGTRIDVGLTVSDVDNTTLTSATVSIGNGFHSGEDVLAFNNTNSLLYGNISSSYNSATGVLTLTSSGGVASLGQWQEALRAVIYRNTSDSPNSANRSISFAVNDGTSDSNAGSKVLSVSAVNDAPVNAVPAGQDTLRDQPLIFNNANGNLITVSDVDAGNNMLEVTLTVSHGTLTLFGTTGLVFSTGDGSTDSSMTFTGTRSDINSALNGMVYRPAAGYSGNDSLQITTNDLGNTGSGGALSDTDSIAISVIVPNPVVQGVTSSTPDGTYKVGDTVTVIVTFDQSVTVSGGTPTLLLETGAIDRLATYVSGSGSNSLTFTYTVQAGDVSADLDFNSSAALALNGASIQNATTENAVLTLPTPGSANSLGANKAIVIDGLAPLVTSVGVPANGTYVAGQDLDFTVNFNDSVLVTGAPGLALDIGGQTVYATYVSGSGSNALVFRLSVQNGQLDSDGISVGAGLTGGTIRDSAGNDAQVALNNVGSTLGVRIDALAPSVVSVDVPAVGSYKAGSVLSFTVNTSEAVLVSTNGGTPRLALDLGGRTVYADYVSGSGGSALVFQYRVQAGDTDADGIQVIGLQANGSLLTDAATNSANLTLNQVGDTAGVSVDTSAPTVAFSGGPAAGSYKAGSVLDFRLDASEALQLDTRNGTPRLALDIGGRTAYADFVGSTPGGGMAFRYTVQAGDNDADGIQIVSLQANGAVIADAAGNPLNTALTTVGDTSDVQVDTTAPTVSSISRVDASPSNAQALAFDVNFSEKVSGLEIADFALQATGSAHGTVLSVVQIGEQTWRVTVGQVAGDGNLTLSMNASTGVRDGAANTLQNGFVGETYVLDHSSPQVSGVTLPADGRYTPGQTLNFGVDFSEAVVVDTRGGIPRIAITLDQGGTVYADYVSGSGTSHLVFAYTVGSGQADNNGIQLGDSILANGANLTDALGNLANLALGSLPSTRGLLVQGSLGDGDPQYRTEQGIVPVVPGLDSGITGGTPVLQSVLPDVGPPMLGQAPLLDSSNRGTAQSGLGSVFREGPSQSQLALIFANHGNSAFGDGSGHGFLGFGGGDAGVFGNSTLGAIFSAAREGDEQALSAFGQRQADISQGLRGVFGSAGLGQQLQEMNQREQRQVADLAHAFGELGQVRPAS